MTNLLTFNQSTALSLYQSDEQFPINFDNAWQWLGYSKKENAKRQLARFKNGVDYSSQLSKNGQRGRSSELIMISIDCFKYLAMMAETELGDAARMYFLECERIAKCAIAPTQPQLPPITNAKLTELTTKEASIQQEIKDIEKQLSVKRQELQEVSQALITEAKAYKAANADSMQQALLCQQILDKAKQNNAFFSPGNTKT